ncbi:MAG: hypothetical protein J6K94_01470 [Ruminiclostridium sp.]|nr:hypothetical protein [Ruminiclostridium sp.]
MSGMISKIWNGSLSPVRQLGEGNRECRELEKLMERNLETLKRELGESAKETLRKYNLCVEEYLLVCCEQSFCDGFSLGTRITAEGFLGTEKH